ncbi:MAG: class E sortase [Rubrobacter sp.]
MLLREIRRRLAQDPLLKVGVVAMTLALALAGVAVFIALLEGPQWAAAAKSVGESTRWPLARSDPDTGWWTGGDTSPTGTSPEPGSRAGASGSGGSGYGSSPDQSRQALPLDEYDFPLPTDQQLQATNRPRHYNLPPGAIMSLTINTLGLNNVPVLSSNTTRALDQGVIHLPGTSLPWSDTPETNVYLAGHRLGWPGTGSHLVFYRLNELGMGDRITLRDREGRRYDYRVIESFEVGPFERWVTGRVRGRDLLTLQTCTPIPTFEKRLIVRAERI